MSNQHRAATRHARRIAWLRAKEISLMAQLEEFTAGRTHQRPRNGIGGWLKVHSAPGCGGLVLTAHCPNEILPHVKALASDLEGSIRRAMGITIPVAVVQVKPWTGRGGQW